MNTTTLRLTPEASIWLFLLGKLGLTDKDAMLIKEKTLALSAHDGTRESAEIENDAFLKEIWEHQNIFFNICYALVSNTNHNSRLIYFYGVLSIPFLVLVIATSFLR